MRVDQIDGDAVAHSRGGSSLRVAVPSPAGAVGVAGSLAEASTGTRKQVDLHGRKPGRRALKPVAGWFTRAATSRDGSDPAAAVTTERSRLAAGAVVAAVASLPATPLRGPAQHVDRSVLSWVVDHRQTAWQIPARRLTALAKPSTVVPVLAASAGWATYRGVAVTRVARVLGVAGAGIAARRALEETVRRSRPPSDWWWQQPSGYSYPSKHVTWSVLGYGAAADLVGDGRLPVRGLATAVSAVVAGTRIVLAEHWPSDVLAAVGLAVAMRRLLRG